MNNLLRKTAKICLAAVMALVATGCSSGGSIGGPAFTEEDLQGMWRNAESTDKVYFQDDQMSYRVNGGTGSSEFYISDDGKLEPTVRWNGDETQYKVEKDEEGNLTLFVDEEKFEKAKVEKPQEINGSDPIELEFFKFNLLQPEVSDVMQLPVSPYTFTRVQQASDQFFYFPLNLTNLQGQAFSLWEGQNHKVLFKFQDKYEYEGEIRVLSTVDLNPLTDYFGFLYAEVPTKVIESSDDVVVTFGFDDNFEHLLTGSDTTWEMMDHVYVVDYPYEYTAGE